MSTLFFNGASITVNSSHYDRSVAKISGIKNIWHATFLSQRSRRAKLSPLTLGLSPTIENKPAVLIYLKPYAPGFAIHINDRASKNLLVFFNGNTSAATFEAPDCNPNLNGDSSFSFYGLSWGGEVFAVEDVTKSPAQLPAGTYVLEVASQKFTWGKSSDDFEVFNLDAVTIASKP
ncbi:hypothetical protein BGX27_010243 [Mortierella sp. AM989]|nr:hypothetical protein BGX27_010243 [Mortierella sp. AM989]